MATAEIALNGVREEARVGQRTTLDVLNAQQELVNARTALVTAQHDRVVASYNLLAGVGELNLPKLGLNIPLYDPMVHYRAGSRCLGRGAHSRRPLTSPRRRRGTNEIENRGFSDGIELRNSETLARRPIRLIRSRFKRSGRNFLALLAFERSIAILRILIEMIRPT